MVADPAEQYAELIAAVARGESLPIAWYTDPAIAALEMERIFRRTWQYVGPLSELAGVGDYITGFAGNVPVVVVRNDAGLGGYVNVCRHRRHQVMKGRGSAKVMQCGYHAWTYDLAGCLRGAPRSQNEPNFALADYPLLPARAEALGPWVFVNLDLDARPLRSCFGGALDLLAQTGIDLDDLQLRQRDEWESGVNWKTMLENYLECYHCAVAHPAFSALVDVRPENYRLTASDGHLSQVAHARAPARDGFPGAQYHVLWPNCTISVNPGFANLELDVWIPDGPHRTRGFSEHYFGRGVSNEFAERMIAFNAHVGAEDDALTDSVQIGLRSGLPERGRYLTGAERLTLDFLRLVVEGIAGGR